MAEMGQPSDGEDNGKGSDLLWEHPFLREPDGCDLLR